MKNATIIMLAFLATACNVFKEDKINAFVLNGEPQPDQMIYSLIDAMCEEASN